MQLIKQKGSSMKRSGFTMVELIFVIVIIGILAATALPKFGDVKDKAKINSELANLSGLDGALLAAVEFQIDNFGNRNISWHNETITNPSRLNTRYNTTQAYHAINNENKVLSKIAKKVEKLVIQGAASTNGTNIVAWTTDTNPANDILFLTSTASDPITGVNKPIDIKGKPDSNDLWVFNPNDFDLNITSNGNYPLASSPTIIPATSITLLDFNDTNQIAKAGTQNMRNLTVVRYDSNASTVTNDVLEIQ